MWYSPCKLKSYTKSTCTDWGTCYLYYYMHCRYFLDSRFYILWNPESAGCSFYLFTIVSAYSNVCMHTGIYQIWREEVYEGKWNELSVCPYASFSWFPISTYLQTSNERKLNFIGTARHCREFYFTNYKLLFGRTHTTHIIWNNRCIDSALDRTQYISLDSR